MSLFQVANTVGCDRDVDDRAKAAAICNLTGDTWMISMIAEYDLRVDTAHSGFIASFKRRQLCPITVGRHSGSIASDKWFSHGVRNAQSLMCHSVRIVWGIVHTGNANVLATLVQSLAREHMMQLQREIDPLAPAGGLPLVTYDNADSKTYSRWLAIGFQPTGGTNENGELQLIYTRHLEDDEAVGQDLRTMDAATRADKHRRVLQAVADATDAASDATDRTFAIKTKNVAKYTVGQEMKDFGKKRRSGTITSVIPKARGETSGPGRLIITQPIAAKRADAPAAQWSYQIETIPLRSSGITLRVHAVSIDGMLPAPDARTLALVQALRRMFPNNFVVLRTTTAYLKENRRAWAGTVFFVLPSDDANGTGGDAVRMLCLG